LDDQYQTLEIVDESNWVRVKVTIKRDIMSLVPEFELGLWNAWIITVLGVIFGFLTPYINKEVADKRMGDVKFSAKK